MKTERIILVCDGCGADDGDGNGPVTTHRITIDRASWAVEACSACWGGKFREALTPLTAPANGVRIRSRRGNAAGRLRAV